MSGAVVISGPTASGKSALALSLASRLDAEIISADSAQVYVGMDIGTAKPDASIQAQVPHHLIDIRAPDEPYSASDFRQDAVRLVGEITARGKLPLITGGTMLYLKALKEGLAPLPAAVPEIRAQLLAEAAMEGWVHLHAELTRVDPVAAARIRPSDTQRLQRALEVYRSTGVSLTEHHLQGAEPCPFPLLEIALVPPDRALLHQAIATRFHEMLERGFVDEVRNLRENPNLHADLPAVKAVGYRQVWAFLDGEKDEQSMVDSGIAATRQLAKRQYTWLRSWDDLHQLNSPDTSQALKIIGNSTILG